MWFRWKVRGNADKGTAEKTGTHTWWKTSSTSGILKESIVQEEEGDCVSHHFCCQFKLGASKTKCVSQHTHKEHKLKQPVKDWPLQNEILSDNEECSCLKILFTEWRVKSIENIKCYHYFLILGDMYIPTSLLYRIPVSINCLFMCRAKVWLVRIVGKSHSGCCSWNLWSLE